LEEEAMSEAKNNAKMAGPASTADDSRKLSEDARGLGPWQAGRFTIGVVDTIVGEGGLEIPGYKATKYEILHLARHWAGEILDLDFDFFLYGSTGSTEWRIREYAERRLNTIAKSIGEEEVRKAVTEAKVGFSTGVDERAWKIFTEGTKEEQESFQQEVQEKLAGDPVSARTKHKSPEHTEEN
jgi:hypothetical protein